MGNADQLSVISLLLIDKSPLTLSHIWRKAKEGNTLEFKIVLNFKILPPLKKEGWGGLKMLN